MGGKLTDGIARADMAIGYCEKLEQDKVSGDYLMRSTDYIKNKTQKTCPASPGAKEPGMAPAA